MPTTQEIATENVYDLGNVVRTTGEFLNSEQTPIDPTTVGVRVENPNGLETTALFGVVDSGVQRVAPGKYHFDIRVDQAGRWHYQWYSTGVGEAAASSSFRVKRSRFR
jgi:hypothetical protein